VIGCKLGIFYLRGHFQSMQKQNSKSSDFTDKVLLGQPGSFQGEYHLTQADLDIVPLIQQSKKPNANTSNVADTSVNSSTNSQITSSVPSEAHTNSRASSSQDLHGDIPHGKNVPIWLRKEDSSPSLHHNKEVIPPTPISTKSDPLPRTVPIWLVSGPKDSNLSQRTTNSDPLPSAQGKNNQKEGKPIWLKQDDKERTKHINNNNNNDKQNNNKNGTPIWLKPNSEDSKNSKLLQVPHTEPGTPRQNLVPSTM
jgi:hypothetical protein